VEAGGGAVALQQRLECAGELHRDGDVAADVGTEPVERRGVVVAVHAGMQRHHQAVVHRHPRHLQQQVAAQRRGLHRSRRARTGRREDPLGVALIQRGGADVGVAVVGGDGAVRDEVAAPVLQRGDEALVVGGVGVGRGAERVDQLTPVASARLQVAVGAEGRQHPSGHRGVVADGRVVGQVVARVVRGGQHLDAEALQQRPRPEVGPAHRRRDLVVDRVGGGGGRPYGHPEDLGELALQPEPARRAAEGVPVGAQRPPGRPRPVGGCRAAGAEALQRNAVGMQQPGDVVVGGDQQGGRIPERDVLRDPVGRHVPVRGDDRQVAHRGVEPARDAAGRRVGGKEPIRMELQRCIGHRPMVRRTGR
jgi:hypothetical protein